MSDQYDQETARAADVPEEESIDEVLTRMKLQLAFRERHSLRDIRNLFEFARYATMHLTDGQLDEATRILNQK